MSEQFITGSINNKPISIFILRPNRSKECLLGKNHLWEDVILYSNSGKRIDWKYYRQWAHLTSEVRDRLIMEFHELIDDPITMGSTACLHCGISYTEWDNPWRS